jgi:hypothetical protein
MTDDFEDRIKAAAQRVHAAKQSKVDNREKQLRAEEAEVAKINGAIKDWNGRIAPAIVSSIGRANAIIRNAGAKVQLTSNVTTSRTIQIGRLGPPIPSLPVMIVGARSGAIPKASLAAQLAGARQAKASLQDFARSPRLQFSVNAEAKVAISPQNYPSKTHGVMEVGEFGKEIAESLILEFAEAVMSSSE